MSSPSKWRWLRAETVLAIHEAQLKEHGGLSGVRSTDLLASALARPENFAAYQAEADAVSLGALYAIAIAHNHPFIDGNKRIAWVAMRTFLILNGVTLTYDPVDAVTEMLALAASQRTDEQFTEWVRAHVAHQ